MFLSSRTLVTCIGKKDEKLPLRERNKDSSDFSESQQQACRFRERDCFSEIFVTENSAKESEQIKLCG